MGQEENQITTHRSDKVLPTQWGAVEHNLLGTKGWVLVPLLSSWLVIAQEEHSFI